MSDRICPHRRTPLSPLRPYDGLRILLRHPRLLAGLCVADQRVAAQTLKIQAGEHLMNTPSVPCCVCHHPSTPDEGFVILGCHDHIERYVCGRRCLTDYAYERALAEGKTPNPRYAPIVTLGPYGHDFDKVER